MTLTSYLAAAKTAIEALLESSPDTCDVIRVTSTTDDYGGSTSSETTLASNIPCLYEERTYADRPIGGTTENYATHDLFLKSTSVTRLIQPHYKIVVAARDDNPELTFEDPVYLGESLSPLVHLGASIKA